MQSNFFWRWLSR